MSRKPRVLLVIAVPLAILAHLAVTCAASAADSGDDQAATGYRAAYSLVLDERWGEAAASFADLAKRFPASEWADDAEF